MHDGHGHTPAAWTAVVIIMIGTLFCAVTVLLAKPAWFVVGLVVIALGGVVGKVMQLMGLGQQREESAEH